MRSFKVLVLLTLLAAVPVVAAEEPTRAAARPLATMHVTPDAVTWEAEASGGLELAVANPDGAVVRYQFAAGEIPMFALFDQDGQRLPDGVYTYELRSARELRPGRSLLHSGSLAIRDGSFVEAETPTEQPGKGPRPIFAADQVIPDDLIVQGNACIGTACADGEIMSGNLEIKSTSPAISFEDTGGGVSGTHDWLLLINGAFAEESFKVFDLDSNTTPFTLTGGAPTHSLYVSSTGNVGLGTSIPDAKLHVPSGEVRFDSSHATLETHFKFSGNSQNYLRGTTIIADDATGSNVGIGCDAPGSDLVVGGTASSCATAPWSRINAGDANWSSSSSRTFKENLSPVQVPDILEKMAGVGVYTYDFIKGPKDRIGLMAEDFHQVFGRGSDKEIDGSEVEMALWLAVRELTARIAVLEARLAEKAEAQ